MRCLACFLTLSFAAVAAAQYRSAMEAARNKMVDEEIVAAGVKNDRVIRAMRETPRHEFVPLHLRKYAYYDMALPIGERQTISPPFVVAYMTESIDPQPTDKVLEIGTGSGYQAAVLAKLVRSVYSIEIVESLGRKAAKTLERLRYDNVWTKVGDGYLGWPEHAPFDKIIVTCSPEKVPAALVEQLKEGGRMVIPVGERYQQTLYLLKKSDGKMVTEALRPTLFVPMTGHAEAQREIQPDPTKPALFNGGFELFSGDPPALKGWHYQRQLKVVEALDAPTGNAYVVFGNETPGRGSWALQGFAVDGLKVPKLKLSVWVRGNGVRQGQNAKQIPGVIINFFDENRAAIGAVGMGPWRGTFDWRHETKLLQVPRKAREAVLGMGLYGAVGEIAFDELKLVPAEN
ncbi:MAG: protein-L-isoaspartate(D-aspartate) O-methyltransferase [Pirellulales bacterium]|nr:protein-L-isoaspartate(D-aspartate) O-methyltransferase [Pirellulales bacterium]